MLVLSGRITIKGALLLVVTIRLDGDVFPEGHVSDGVLRSFVASQAII